VDLNLLGRPNVKRVIYVEWFSQERCQHGDREQAEHQIRMTDGPIGKRSSDYARF